MSEWTKERRCEKCGATFTLEQHGHEGAKVAAESLERGTAPVEGADYFAVRFCPPHLKEVVEMALADAFAGATGGGRTIKDVTPKQAVIGWILLAALIGGGFLVWKFLL